MHEKVAFIDGRVLWYGSLNIMSHRDTSESMFRIPSAKVCEQLAEFLGEGTDPTAGAGNPSCRVCGKPTVWKNSTYRVHFKCESCGSEQSRGGQARKTAGTAPACPKHAVPMVLRQGPRGPFYGCPMFPECRETRGA